VETVGVGNDQGAVLLLGEGPEGFGAVGEGGEGRGGEDGTAVLEGGLDEGRVGCGGGCHHEGIDLGQGPDLLPILQAGNVWLQVQLLGKAVEGDRIGVHHGNHLGAARVAERSQQSTAPATRSHQDNGNGRGNRGRWGGGGGQGAREDWGQAQAEGAAVVGVVVARGVGLGAVRRAQWRRGKRRG